MCRIATFCILFLKFMILDSNTHSLNSVVLIREINHTIKFPDPIDFNFIGVYILKKFVTTILATSAAALGLFVAGTVSADASTTYTVKSGDSVWAISQKFDSTINAIENANNIQGHLILPGQNLTIPDGTSTSTQTAATTNTQANTQAAATTNTQQAATTSQATTNTNTNTNSQASTTSSSSSSYTGSNMKEYVLSQMSSRTGVSASTWNAIIQRESNWQANVVNSTSGAYGLFQNMHISSGSVEDQVNAAVSLYNQQGMAAWAL